MSNAVHIVRRVTRTMIHLTDGAAKRQEFIKIEPARSEYVNALQALEKTPADEAGQAFRTKIKDAQRTARALNEKVIERATANQDAEALTLLMAEAGPATQKWLDTLHEDIDLKKSTTKKM